jgi:hypothetical protein
VGLIIQNNEVGALGNYVIFREPGKSMDKTAFHTSAGIISYSYADAHRHFIYAAFELMLGSRSDPDSVIFALRLENDTEIAEEITDRWEEINAGHVRT